MLKNSALNVFGCLLALLCLPGATLRAQDGVLDEFYGTGVHNFYERDYFQAMHNLSTAIDGGSRDPRVYYYRGLSKLRSGDTSARRSICSAGPTWRVPTSLTSIPWPARWSACKDPNGARWSDTGRCARPKRDSARCGATPCDTKNVGATKRASCDRCRSGRRRRPWVRRLRPPKRLVLRVSHPRRRSRNRPGAAARWHSVRRGAGRGARGRACDGQSVRRHDARNAAR